jgi:hypothetical protein
MIYCPNHLSTIPTLCPIPRSKLITPLFYFYKKLPFSLNELWITNGQRKWNTVLRNEDDLYMPVHDFHFSHFNIS